MTDLKQPDPNQYVESVTTDRTSDTLNAERLKANYDLVDTWPDWKLDTLTMAERNRRRASGETLPKPTKLELDNAAQARRIAELEAAVMELHGPPPGPTCHCEKCCDCKPCPGQVLYGKWQQLVSVEDDRAKQRKEVEALREGLRLCVEALTDETSLIARYAGPTCQLGPLAHCVCPACVTKQSKEALSSAKALLEREWPGEKYVNGQEENS